MRTPTVDVVRAFGADDRYLRPLPGGQQAAWSDGRLVLKPVGSLPEHLRVSDVHARWAAPDVVRVPEPVASAHDEAWVVAGWAAHVLVPGRDAEIPGDLDVVRHASDAFHEQIRGLERPSFLDERDDRWAFGDRVAWEGLEPQGDGPILLLAGRLRAALRPVRARAQVIHGDICGNVLVADGLPPAVIDWPPYHRPAGLALAIAATDAISWSTASPDLLDDWAGDADWDQLLLRGLLYRLATTGWLAARGRANGLREHVARVQPLVELVLARQRD